MSPARDRERPLAHPRRADHPSLCPFLVRPLLLGLFSGCTIVSLRE